MFLQSSTLIGSQVFKLVYKTNKNMYRTHFLLFLFSFLLAKNLQFPQVQHLSIELSAWKMKKKIVWFFFLLSHYIITRYSTIHTGNQSYSSCITPDRFLDRVHQWICKCTCSQRCTIVSFVHSEMLNFKSQKLNRW